MRGQVRWCRKPTGSEIFITGELLLPRNTTFILPDLATRRSCKQYVDHGEWLLHTQYGKATSSPIEIKKMDKRRGQMYGIHTD